MTEYIEIDVKSPTFNIFKFHFGNCFLNKKIYGINCFFQREAMQICKYSLICDRNNIPHEQCRYYSI